MTRSGARRSLLAVASLLFAACGTTQPSGLVATATPTAPVDLAIQCGEVAVDECRTVAQAAVSEPGTAAKVAVERFEPACLRAVLCLHPRGGWQWSHTVTVTRIDGTIEVLVCQNDEPRRCGPAPPEETAELAAVRIELVGSSSREVQMDSDEASHGFTVSGFRLQRLVIGGYQFAARFADDPECPCTHPAFRGSPPPEWCSARLDAASGHHYELTITVADGRCSMEIVDLGPGAT